MSVTSQLIYARTIQWERRYFIAEKLQFKSLRMSYNRHLENVYYYRRKDEKEAKDTKR